MPDLLFPCGHAITVADDDGRFRFGPTTAQLVADVVIYCPTCWKQYGETTWREPGEIMKYANGETDWHNKMIRAGWQAQTDLTGMVVAYHHRRGAKIEGAALIEAWRRINKTPPPF